MSNHKSVGAHQNGYRSKSQSAQQRQTSLKKRHLGRYSSSSSRPKLAKSSISRKQSYISTNKTHSFGTSFHQFASIASSSSTCDTKHTPFNTKHGLTATNTTTQSFTHGRHANQQLATKRTHTTRAQWSTPMTSSAGRSFSTKAQPTRVLLTGACGQIGSELASALQNMLGHDNVIATDVRRPMSSSNQVQFEYLDVLDIDNLKKLVVNNGISKIVHLASILSALGEQRPELAMELNSRGIENVLKVAAQHHLSVFAPSTIAAFGGSTPRDNTPDVTIMRPNTMYGVTKVYLELLGAYYAEKMGVDFRSVRYPGIVSSGVEPGGGTTDWTIAMYQAAVKTGQYTCFLSENSTQPMLHMQDCLQGTLQLMFAPREHLTQTVYNIAGCSYSPAQCAESIRRHFPGFQVTYQPDFRQKIADSWPLSLDDSVARRDWGWSPQFDLEMITNDMLRSYQTQQQEIANPVIVPDSTPTAAPLSTSTLLSKIGMGDLSGSHSFA